MAARRAAVTVFPTAFGPAIAMAGRPGSKLVELFVEEPGTVFGALLTVSRVRLLVHPSTLQFYGILVYSSSGI